MLYETVEAFKARMDGNQPWDWPNFTPEELACKCGGKHCQGEYFHDPEFLDMLQTLRNEWGRPLIVNSGHRCSGHNAEVGGAVPRVVDGVRLPGSMHLRIAVDLRVTDYDLREKRKLYNLSVEAGFRGIGRAKTFIHLDNRKSRSAEWFYAGAWVKW